MARPSNVRLVFEGVVVAILSVIVTKVAARLIGGDVSSAVLGGVAAGVTTVWFTKRAKDKNAQGKR